MYKRQSQKAEAEKERAELQRKTASLDDRRATLMKDCLLYTSRCV